jgi:trans-aconitate methyltransferase
MSIYKLYSNTISRFCTKHFGGFHAGTVARGIHIRHVLKYYVNKNTKSIMDAGCGPNAGHVVMLSYKYPNIEFYGVNLYFDNEMKLNKNNVKLYTIDLLIIPFSNKFDIIYSIDVLEHIENYKECIKRLFIALKENGILIIHIPNKKRNLAMNFSEKKLENRPGENHVRDGFEKEELLKDLVNQGFKILNAKYTFGKILTFIKKIYTALERKKFPGTGILLLPFIVFATYLEIIFPPKNGDGILIAAVKK